MDARARDAPLRVEDLRELQLAAGAGRRPRHRAFLLRAQQQARRQRAICASTTARRTSTSSAPITAITTSRTRNVGDDGNYVPRLSLRDAGPADARAASSAMRATRNNPARLDGHIWVPIDDTTTHVYNIDVRATIPRTQLTPKRVETREKARRPRQGRLIPGTFRLKRNQSNDYLIDRQMQKTQNFTGIVGVNTQDFALQEGMGPICDRSKEFLGTSDKAIVAMRRLLLEAIERVEKGGTPRGARSRDLSQRARLRPRRDRRRATGRSDGAGTGGQMVSRRSRCNHASRDACPRTCSSFSIALSDNPRTRPIIEGRVSPEGDPARADDAATLRDVLASAPLRRFRRLGNVDVDADDPDLAGRRDWVGLPIYTMRKFFHTEIIVRTKIPASKCRPISRASASACRNISRRRRSGPAACSSTSSACKRVRHDLVHGAQRRQQPRPFDRLQGAARRQRLADAAQSPISARCC